MSIIGYIHTSRGLISTAFIENVREPGSRQRGELDALYAHLYGLTRDELAYILDTFPIVRRKDEARWGEYRTKRMVLESFSELQDQMTPDGRSES